MELRVQVKGEREKREKGREQEGDESIDYRRGKNGLETVV